MGCMYVIKNTVVNIYDSNEVFDETAIHKEFPEFEFNSQKETCFDQLKKK